MLVSIVKFLQFKLLIVNVRSCTSTRTHFSPLKMHIRLQYHVHSASFPIILSSSGFQLPSTNQQHTLIGPYQNDVKPSHADHRVPDFPYVLFREKIQ